uniref:Uncharacterized protein n=1 Tax=Lactuca sativa TaxID=4236 RepID=A0A9R1WZB9_LACSA|nr:hypothetical protein LSAT_V11C800421120 [Lactuca sativa]
MYRRIAENSNKLEFKGLICVPSKVPSGVPRRLCIQLLWDSESLYHWTVIKDMGKVPPVYILAAFIPAVMITGIYFFDLSIIMKRQFSIIQWETLALLLIGISINQMQALPEGSSRMGVPLEMSSYIYIFIFVTVPSLASVFNEYVLKSQYDTSIYLQFSWDIWNSPESFDILRGRSKATMLLIINNAGQVILSSFFFKYADTILKKYSSTVATIFTGVESATLFGHTLTINFLLGISTVCDSDRIGIQDAGVNMFSFEPSVGELQHPNSWLWLLVSISSNIRLIRIFSWLNLRLKEGEGSYHIGQNFMWFYVDFFRLTAFAPLD